MSILIEATFLPAAWASINAVVIVSMAASFSLRPCACEGCCSSFQDTRIQGNWTKGNREQQTTVGTTTTAQLQQLQFLKPLLAGEIAPNFKASNPKFIAAL